MGGFITAYVDGCDRCQRYRRDYHPTATVQPQEVPEGPWQTIGVDLIDHCHCHLERIVSLT